ncbi:MAG: hypothetical protein NDJ75_05020 [Thermoanaerobaculia bacterium]|nr:hypothetical protein [Thermoanaerobaculia bacterium]
MKALRITLFAAVVALATGSLTPASAGISATVDFGFFYDSLAPHGQWVATAEFGHAWRPSRVGVGWRPYYDGRWVYTDYGWTFVSDDPWGWATYHYGRWTFDPYYGWLWVPGYEWAPAWVVFHQGDGWVGWAPLPPRVSLHVALAGNYRFDPGLYCFVEERHFTDRRVGRHVVRRERNHQLARSTTRVTRFARSGEHYVHRGVDPGRIERATRQRIERRRVVDVVEVRGARTRVGDDRVEVFRPRIGRREAAPPRAEARSPQRRHEPSRVERGGERSRRSAVDARQRQARERDADKKQKPRGKPKPPPAWR